MIGLGKWKCLVSTPFFKGDVIFKIEDSSGAYKIDLELPETGFKTPEFEFSDIKEEGNTLSLTATMAGLPGKKAEAFLSFSGDSFSGFLKVPFLGRIDLQDGVRV